MAETARPRPRPKPRPRVRKASSPPEASSSTGITPSSPHKPTLDVEDEDALFIKNRSRTAQGWLKLEKISKETKPRANRESEEGSDDDTSSPHRRKQKKKAKPGVALPKWARTGAVPIILSSEDDSDEDALQDLGNTPNGKRDQPGSKRKRARSRSRSITPPPALPIHQIQNARNLVRQALEPTPRPASPTGVGDDSTDTIVLDPELAKIAQAVRSQATLPQSSKSDTIDKGGGPPLVMIKVKWQPHPLDEAGKQKIWAFKMKRHDTFREVFEETADLATVLSDNLIMNYDNKRLFSSATPHTLRIWAEAELEACDKATYEYIRTHRHQRSPSLAHDYPNASSRTGSPSGNASAGASDSDGESAQEQDGDKFKLILRSAVTTKDITLTVRPTTTCGAIVKAFLKSAGLADKYVTGNTPKKGKATAAKAPALMIEGEKMGSNNVIGDADVEDGDLVEVVGL